MPSHGLSRVQLLSCGAGRLLGKIARTCKKLCVECDRNAVFSSMELREPYDANHTA